MEKNKYKEVVNRHTPKENVLYNTLIAFITGGLMGILGELLIDAYTYYFSIPTSQASIFPTFGVI